MPYFSNRERPCRLCGTDTSVPGRICWPCRHRAHEAEAAALGLPATVPGALRPLWGHIIGRHIVRRAIADRTRSGLTPLDAAEAVVVEFEHPDAGSRFVTLATAAFDAITLPRLRGMAGLGPPVPEEQLRVHDGRRLFGTAITARLRAAGAIPPADD